MCAMTLATTSAKLLPMRRPEVEKRAGHASRSFSFQQNLVYLAVENHPKRVIQRKSMCDPQKSLHIAAAALL